MSLERRLYSSPPPPQTSMQDNPTLLVSWWCTGFALVIILVRISGRYIRTERLFGEDKVMALSIIPLMIRMGLVHVILIWGTNNVVTTGLTPEEIHHRDIGSRLVLASRIMYAAFLWVAKFTVSEFLKRLTQQVWRRSYQIGLQFIRWFLVLTFIGVVIATLSECRPFNHYWQVVPDPGPQCRQGHAQLITMGASDVITDLLLIVFPIPIVLRSSMPMKRKISLTLLFSLSAILIIITVYRVTATISRHSNQQFRSLLASLEILAAAAVSNALVLGSFVRDRGVKKQRFRFGSTTGSDMDRSNDLTRRGTLITAMTWGSDSDLVGDLGIRLGPEFSNPRPGLPRPAPVALPHQSYRPAEVPPMVNVAHNKAWAFPDRISADSDASEEDIFKSASQMDRTPSPGDVTRSASSFFDIGGLLEDGKSPPRSQNSRTNTSPLPVSPAVVQDGAVLENHRGRQGSLALLQDIGGLLSSGPPRNGIETRSPSSTTTTTTTTTTARANGDGRALSTEPTNRNFSRPRNSQPAESKVGVGREWERERERPRLRPVRTDTLQDVGGLLG